jgi:hypothetical protein
LKCIINHSGCSAAPLYAALPLRRRCWSQGTAACCRRCARTPGPAWGGQLALAHSTASLTSFTVASGLGDPCRAEAAAAAQHSPCKFAFDALLRASRTPSGQAHCAAGIRRRVWALGMPSDGFAGAQLDRGAGHYAAGPNTHGGRSRPVAESAGDAQVSLTTAQACCAWVRMILQRGDAVCLLEAGAYILPTGRPGIAQQVAVAEEHKLMLPASQQSREARCCSRPTRTQPCPALLPPARTAGTR